MMEMEGRLLIAAGNGDVALVAELLDSGVAVDAHAVGAGDKVGYDKVGYTALMCAAENGRVEVARLLLDRGADANEVARMAGVTLDTTALALAAENGHAKVARLLLEHGADADAKVFGKTALMYAAEKGHAETARVMVELGADVNAKDREGKTELFQALLTRHFNEERGEDAMRILLRLGADANGRDSDGYTPLMYAVTVDDEDATTLLLRNGGNPNDVNPEGEAALTVAEREKSHFAAAALIAHDWGTRDALARTVSSVSEYKISADFGAEVVERTAESITCSDAALPALCALLATPDAERRAKYEEAAERSLSRMSHIPLYGEQVGEFQITYKWILEAAALEAATAAGRGNPDGFGAGVGVSDTGLIAVVELFERCRLTRHVLDMETAKEALEKSFSRDGACNEESPYYKAAKEYFEDVPNGHLAFAELVRQVAETRAQHPAFETVSGADWDEPCL